MLNVFNGLFNIKENDYLSTSENGPLNSDNIKLTIDKMVEKVTFLLGYTSFTPFTYKDYHNLDALYNDDQSIIIPIFNENYYDYKTKNDNQLPDNLIDANVSLLVITSKSGDISPIDSTSNAKYCIDGQGIATKNDDNSNITIVDDKTLGKVLSNRLINLKLYRHAYTSNNSNNFDYHPICYDAIDTCCYCHTKKTIDNNEKEDVKVCINGYSFYIRSQVLAIDYNSTCYLLPTVLSNFVTDDAKPLNENGISSNDFGYINNLNENVKYCRIFNYFYKLKKV